MPRRITLHHPDLDVTIVRNPRQARVLAASGWRPVGEQAAPPEPEPPQPPDDDEAGDTEE